MSSHRTTFPHPPAVPADAAWAATLDAASLARLHELDPTGRSGLVARVLATYAQSLARMLDQLRMARAAADLAALRHVTHTLKSSSASVGALRLSALCAEVESRVRDGRLEGLEPALDDLVGEAERLLAALSGSRS